MLKNQSSTCRVESVDDQTNLITLQLGFSGYLFSVPMQMAYMSQSTGPGKKQQAGLHVLPKKDDIVEVTWDDSGNPSISGFLSVFHPSGKQIYQRPDYFSQGAIALASDTNSFIAMGAGDKTEEVEGQATVFTSVVRAGKGETKGVTQDHSLSSQDNILSDGTTGTFFSDDGVTELSSIGDLEFPDEATFSMAADISGLFPGDIGTPVLNDDAALIPEEIKLKTVLPCLVYSDTAGEVTVYLYGKSFSKYALPEETFNSDLLKAVLYSSDSDTTYPLKLGEATDTQIPLKFLVQASPGTEGLAQVPAGIYGVTLSRKDGAFSASTAASALTVRVFQAGSVDTPYFDSRGKVQFILPEKTVRSELQGVRLAFLFREGISDTVMLWDGSPFDSSKHEYWPAKSFTYQDFTLKGVKTVPLVGYRSIKDAVGNSEQLGFYAAVHDSKTEVQASQLNACRVRSLPAALAQKGKFPENQGYLTFTIYPTGSTTQEMRDKLINSVQKDYTGQITPTQITFKGDTKGLKTNTGLSLSGWDPGSSFEIYIAMRKTASKYVTDLTDNGTWPQPEALNITPRSVSTLAGSLPRTLFVVKGRGFGLGTSFWFIQVSRTMERDGKKVEVALNGYTDGQHLADDVKPQDGLRFGTWTDEGDAPDLEISGSSITIPSGGPAWAGGTCRMRRASDRIIGIELKLSALPPEYLGTYIVVPTASDESSETHRTAPDSSLYNDATALGRYPTLKIAADTSVQSTVYTPSGAPTKPTATSTPLPGTSYYHEEVGSIDVDEFETTQGGLAFAFDVDNKGNAFFQTKGQFLVNGTVIGDIQSVGTNLETNLGNDVSLVTASAQATFGTKNGTVRIGAFGSPGNMFLDNSGVFAAAHDATRAYFGRKSPKISVGAEFRRDQEVRVGPVLFPSMSYKDPDQQKGDVSDYGIGATYKAVVSFQIRQLGDGIDSVTQPKGPEPNGVPSVDGVTPGSGDTLVTHTLTITGTGFTGASQVSFVNGTTNYNLTPTVVDDTKLKVVVPTGMQEKEYAILVTNPVGRNIASNVTYVASAKGEWTYYRGALNLLFVPRRDDGGKGTGKGTKSEPFEGALVIPLL